MLHVGQLHVHDKIRETLHTQRLLYFVLTWCHGGGHSTGDYCKETTMNVVVESSAIAC